MERNDGYVIPLGQLSDAEHNTSVMLPYGVFAVICPFNFPFALAVGMSTGALVTGNTVVMKPAEETPWSTGLIGELAVEAGLPAGRAQRGPGRRRDRARTGRRGHRRRRVHRLGRGRPRRSRARCTTRGPCGRWSSRWAARTRRSSRPARTSRRAAAGIVRSAYGLSGQKCSSCSRVVVDARGARRAAWSGSPPARACWCSATPPTRRPRSARSRAPDAIEASTPRSRRPAATARSWSAATRDGGFVSPTLVTGLPRGHRLTRDELFLPFLTVTPVDSLDDAIERPTPSSTA